MKEGLTRDKGGTSSMPQNASGATGKSMAAPKLDLQATREGEQTLLANASNSRSIATEIANSMASEMVNNAGGSICATIRSKWNSWWPNEKIEALMMWKEMVDYGAEWDHKKFLLDNYGEWHRDSEYGVEWYFDIWSNIHYGYVGAACGFSPETLLNGAGVAQLLGSNVPDGWRGWFERASTHGLLGALDDDSDQIACRIGMILWGQNFDGDTMRYVMNSNKNDLTHRTIA